MFCCKSGGSLSMIQCNNVTVELDININCLGTRHQ